MLAPPQKDKQPQKTHLILVVLANRVVVPTIFPVLVCKEENVPMHAANMGIALDKIVVFKLRV
jgi:hypothetical protein